MCNCSFISYRRNTLRDHNPLTVLINPIAAEAETAVREAFLHRRTLIVVGRCNVIYKGRAKSKLEPGERIAILKSDGSLLIHRSAGYEPVNWQPPGCIFNVRDRKGILEIEARRQRPRESVEVAFDNIQLLSVHDLTDLGEFSLYASEEDMQKAILLNPSMLEEGFEPISYEKKIEPGFVDVYGTDRNGKLVVVEIKRKTAGKEAALQLAKYIKAVRTKSTREVRGILAAPRIAKDVQRMLVTLGLGYKSVDPKKCAEMLRRSQTVKLADFLQDS